MLPCSTRWGWKWLSKPSLRGV